MISNIYANDILEVLCGTGSLSTPSKIYLGLSSTAPDSATGIVTGEPTAPSYVRIIVGGTNVTPDFEAFGSASGGVIENTEEINFKTAREAWGTMKYFFLSTSATTGAAYLWGKIIKDGVEGVTVGAETVPTFYEGELRISLDVSLT